MSFRAMAWASEQTPKNTTNKLCLLIMGSMANQDNQCWPSHRHLADQCCCTRRTIIKVVKQLEDDGYIVSEHRSRGRERTSNMYTLMLDRVSVGAGGSEQDSPPSEQDSPGGSEQDSHETVTISKQSEKHTVRNEFERWWKHYPKKTNKIKAWAVWQKIKPDADKLIADVEERKIRCGKWLREIYRDPERYLKYEQWNDEFEPIQGGGQKVISTPADRNRKAQQLYLKRLHEQRRGQAKEVFEHDEIS